jgi:hypothetical protein
VSAIIHFASYCSVLLSVSCPSENLIMFSLRFSKVWKVNLSLCLIIYHHTMKTHESRCIAASFLISVIFTPRPPYPKGKSPGTHWIEATTASRFLKSETADKHRLIGSKQNCQFLQIRS